MSAGEREAIRMGRRDRLKRRRAAAEREMPSEWRDSVAWSGVEHASTRLHEERLDAVTELLIKRGVRTVLDLGCGAGPLLHRLVAEEQFERIVGVDSSIQALAQAETSLGIGKDEEDRVSLLHASFAGSEVRLAGYDAAVMVETIEHILPERLSVVERVVFAEWRPRFVILTTPNRDYNPLLGLEEGEYRHPDHCFEWGREKFRSWAAGVAQRNGYEVQSGGIGSADPLRGRPTHIAEFRLLPPGAAAP